MWQKPLENLYNIEAVNDKMIIIINPCQECDNFSGWPVVSDNNNSGHVTLLYLVQTMGPDQG